MLILNFLIFIIGVCHSSVVPEVIQDQVPVAQQGLGVSCYSMPIRGVNQCPGAFFAEKRRDRFSLSGSLMGNQRLITTANHILDGHLNRAEFRELMENRSAHAAEFSTALAVQGAAYSVMYFPKRVQVFTVIQNPGMPTAKLVATTGQEARLDFASYQTKRFTTSLRLRFIDRKVIAEHIDLIEHSLGGEVAPLNQQIFSVEPSVGFLYGENWFSSSSLVNLAFVSEKSESWPVLPASISSVGYRGDFTVAASIETSRRITKFENGLQLATYIPIRGWSFFAMGSNLKNTAGLAVDGENLKVSLSYEQWYLDEGRSQAVRMSTSLIF